MYRKHHKDNIRHLIHKLRLNKASGYIEQNFRNDILVTVCGIWHWSTYPVNIVGTNKQKCGFLDFVSMGKVKLPRAGLEPRTTDLRKSQTY